VTLDGSLSQGDGLRYFWDFGDGETGSGARVSHAYAKGGHYKAVLTVMTGRKRVVPFHLHPPVSRLTDLPQ